MVLLAAGCSAPEKPRKRFLWPPLDPRPRIEYLNFYQVEQDLRRDERSLLEEYVLGKEQPKNTFNQPQGIVSDGRGKVYVSDLARVRIFVYDFNKREVRVLKDKASARRDGDQVRVDSDQAFPERVWSLDIDQLGHVYAALGPAGEVAVFGVNERLSFRIGKDVLQNPAGVAVDRKRQRLLVVDSKLHQLLVYSLDGELLQRHGQRGAGPGEFNFPIDVDIDGEGNIFVLDAMNSRVQVFDPELKFLRSFGERGTASGSFMVPKSLAVNAEGLVFVTDALAHRVVIFDRSGNYLLTFGGKYFVVDQVAPGGFYLPSGIDVDDNNAIWVSDSLNRMFHKFQYITDSYLAEHPVRPGEAVIPQGLLPTGSGAQPAAAQ